MITFKLSKIQIIKGDNLLIYLFDSDHNEELSIILETDRRFTVKTPYWLDEMVQPTFDRHDLEKQLWNNLSEIIQNSDYYSPHVFRDIILFTVADTFDHMNKELKKLKFKAQWSASQPFDLSHGNIDDVEWKVTNL